MTDATEPSGSGGDAAPPEITFKIKSAGDKTHTVTMAEGATVLELKTKLAGEDYENVPAERQRLIYSGRVMKNDDKLSVYKIKPNNTVHMVKSAASNPTPPSASSSTPAQPAIPSNMAAGTNNDILSGLTGARFAGMANLPNASMFGADGGMGAPPNPDQLARALEDPTVQQTMLAALDNPEFVNMMLNSPHVRNMPGAREVLQSPMLRQLLLNPEMLRLTSRMSDQFTRGGGAFPAPGTTDPPAAGATSDTAAPGTDSTRGGGTNAGAGAGAGAGTGANPPPNPFGFPLMPGLFGQRPADGSNPPPNPFAAMAGQDPTQNPFLAFLGGQPPAAGAGGAAGASGAAAAGSPPGAGAPGGAAGGQQNPFGMPDDAALRSMMEGLVRGMGSEVPPAAPADNRPPEERYEQQLRQLNEMGFYDFDRNIAALRRSGGSVQGAIEFLLGGG